MKYMVLSHICGLETRHIDEIELKYLKGSTWSLGAWTNCVDL